MIYDNHTIELHENRPGWWEVRVKRPGGRTILPGVGGMFPAGHMVGVLLGIRSALPGSGFSPKTVRLWPPVEEVAA